MPDDDRASLGSGWIDKNKMDADARLVHDRFWDKLRKALGQISVVEDILTAYHCAADNHTPVYVKGVLLAALAYFIVPTDVIPDFLAAVGFTDDAAVILAAISSVHENVRPEHRRAARAFLDRKDESAP